MNCKVILLSIIFVSGIFSGCFEDTNDSELLWTGTSPTEYEKRFDVGEYPILAEVGEAADIEVEFSSPASNNWYFTCSNDGSCSDYDTIEYQYVEYKYIGHIEINKAALGEVDFEGGGEVMIRTNS
jgi:hypothetical protein